MTQSEINSATSEPSGVKKIKRPAFQFYPSDWLSDTALRMCSEGARGIWMDMICYMHEGTPYGHLKVNHKVILPQTLARMVGCELLSLEGYLSELVTAGVVQVDADGCMFSKRMVKDEALRNARAAGGKLGGNPNLIDQKVNLEDNLKSSGKDNLNLTPSSSSSSSSTEIKPKRKKSLDVGIIEFIDQCKEAGQDAIPITDPIFTYAEEISLPPEYLSLCWQSFVKKNTYSGNKQKDWRATFRNAVRGNWEKLWWISDDGSYQLTTAGKQALKLQEAGQ